VTPLLALSFVLATVAAGATAGIYLAWPRRLSAEEWVMHRRQAAMGQGSGRSGVVLGLITRDNRWMGRLRATLGLVRADLKLLDLRGLIPTSAEAELLTSLLRLALLGAAAGVLTGIAIWFLSGRAGLPITAVLLTLAFGALLPALRWLRLRRQASQARIAIRRHLPRLLTGTRVLLESGAVTPQQALATAVSVYQDPAADLLREALLNQEVRRVELQEALDQVGRVYGLEPLRRLADAYRVGTRHGTQMADLLSEFALDLRQGEHAAHRERMTRAPVLMTLPALIFFVLPLLALVLLLVLSPLEGAFSQL
jgi:Flp pilus assembly protein TadB